MGQEELIQYGNASIQRQLKLEEWKEEQLQGEKAKLAAPVWQQEVKQTSQPVEDMPRMEADKKQYWQKRKQRKTLESQVNEYNKMKKNKVTADADEGAFDPIPAEQLTPLHVLENFAFVRNWVESYPDKESMLYKQTREALDTSLRALGYECVTNKKGNLELKSIPKEEKDKALKENRNLRERVKEEEGKFFEGLADSFYKKKRDFFIQNSKGMLERMKNDGTPYADYYPGFIVDHGPFSQMKDLDEYMKEERNQEALEKHKAVVEKIHEEYQRIGKALTLFCGERTLLDERKVETKGFSMSHVGSELEAYHEETIRDIFAKRLAGVNQKIEVLQRRFDMLEGGIRKILEGRELEGAEAYLLHEIGAGLGEKEEEYRKAEEKASFYARCHKRKEEIFLEAVDKYAPEVRGKVFDMSGIRFMMLVKEGDEQHNQRLVEAMRIFVEQKNGSIEDSKELGELVKPILQPIFEKIIDYDVDSLEGASDEELEEKCREMQEITLIDMILADLGKIKDPDDPQGKTIKENICRDELLYQYKHTVISEYAVKSRTDAMIEAYRLGCLGESSFTKAELITRLSYEENQGLTREALLGFINKKMMLSQILHNTVQGLKKEKTEKQAAIVAINQLKEFDTGAFYGCPNEVLIKNREKLQEMSNALDRMAPIEKKYSLGKNEYNGDENLWILKRDIVKYYANRARLLFLKENQEHNNLNVNDLTEAEREELKKQKGLGTVDEITEEHLDSFLQEKWVQQEHTEKDIYTAYLKNLDFGDFYLKSKAEEWSPEIHHKDIFDEKNAVEDRLNKMKAEREERWRKEEEGKEEEEVKRIRAKRDSRNIKLVLAEEIQKELDTIQKEDISQNQELQNRKKKLERELIYTDLLLQTESRNYRMADEIDSGMLSENFSRVDPLWQTLPAFAQISDEEMLTMFQKLNAGIRVKRRSTPEEIEAYREENVEGLMQYKQLLIAHTRNMGEKYHFKMPSIEYIREHFEELMHQVGLSQLHSRMAFCSSDMFDLTKPEEQKLFYDVLLMGEIGHSIKLLDCTLYLGYEESIEDWERGWLPTAKNREALMNELKKQTVDKEEQLLTDRFRNLAQDAAVVLRRGNELQGEEQRRFYLEFLERAKELRDYVEQNEAVEDIVVDDSNTYYSPEVLRMHQIRAWNRQVQKKTEQVMKKMEATA